MADDLRSILIASIPQDILGEPTVDYIIEYLENQDICDYGIILDEISGHLQQKGFSHIQTDAHGGDMYSCTVYASTKAEIDNFLSQILKASTLDPSKSYGFKGNATYSQIDPDFSNIEKDGDYNLRWAIFPILCVKNNKDIYVDA